ncbi:MAG: sigma-70 family RNA polymerase sigma factor [Actinomycetota bacterium]
MGPIEDFERTIQAARDGQGWALGELFRNLYPRIVRYLRVLEPSDAEDVASDAWLDISTGLDRFEGDEVGLRAWAFTIARRRMIDLRRRRARRSGPPRRSLDERARGGAIEEKAMTQLATQAALERIATLPPEQAEVVLLRAVGGLPVAEIAKIMDKQPGTVRALQQSALRRLATQATERTEEAITR